MRIVVYKDIEEVVFQWFKIVRDQNVLVFGFLFIVKVQEFVFQFGDDFKCIIGWLECFKECYSIIFKCVCGELKSVVDGIDVMKVWVLSFQIILVEYSFSDIFNVDEIGLFFCFFFDKIFEVKGVDCYGGKNSKECVIVMVCLNMLGNEKLLFFVIGKLKKL